jgi:hypothetical protein
LEVSGLPLSFLVFLALGFGVWQLYPLWFNKCFLRGGLLAFQKNHPAHIIHILSPI